VLLVAASRPSSTSASPADLFGAGGPSLGRAGSGLATDSDPLATFRNPAALGFAPGSEITLGFHLGGIRLRCFGEPISRSPRECPSIILADGNRDGVVDRENPDDRWQPSPGDYPAPHGLYLGGTVALRNWLRLSAGITLPLQRLLLIRTEDPWMPYYPRWKNRHQRLALYFGGALRIIDGLYIGGGVSVLARAKLTLNFRVDALVSDEDLAGDDEGPLHVDFAVNPYGIEVDVRPALAPIAAIAWDLGTVNPKLAGLRIGAVYRHPLKLLVEPAVVGLDLYGVVDDVGSFGDVLVPLRTQVLFSYLDFATPRQVALGVGLDKPRFQVALDATWSQWSKALPSVASVDEEGTDIAIGLVDLEPAVVNARPYAPLAWRDTVSLQIGGEVRPKPRPLQGPLGARMREVGIVVRAGYGFEPSFVPEQTGITNFLDNPIHRIAAGLSLQSWNPFGHADGQVALDLFGQAHVLQRRVHTKDPDRLGDGTLPGTPLGGTVDSGGLVVIGGLGVRLGI
jgi:hypothetical protein